MKKTLFFLCLAAGAVWAQSAPDRKVAAVDGYAARVNNYIITYGDVREQVMPYLQQLSQRVQGEELSRQMAQAYIDGREALIEEALLKAEAKNLGLSLPPSVIDNEISRIIRERFNNDRALLTRVLASRRMTYGEWKEEIAEQIKVRIFYDQEVARRASVSERAVREEYDRTLESFFTPLKVRYRYILINKGDSEEDRAIKRFHAESTLTKLQEGADFEEAARDVSEGDPADRPWREIQNIRPEFRPALRETPVSQVSGLVETDDAFYIFQVLERREEGYVPFETARVQIENRLMQAAQDRLHRELMERLADKHYVERY